MAYAIRFHATGGPEVLRWEEVPVPAPGPGEVLVRHTAVGLNFIDTYHRSGLYPLPLPSGLGLEAAGIVEQFGEGVTEVSVGQRVAYAGGPPGAYSQRRVMPAHRLVPLPETIDDLTAAAVMVKGLTAWFLLRRTYRVQPGDTILFHAAAGGVGLLACQWAASLGATVIGTVGSEAKVELARRHGCHHVLILGRDDIPRQVRELTGGKGVPVVYDSVGRTTWETSLDCLAPLGLMVSFGNASGPVPPFSPLLLAEKGSLFLTRPTLMTYTAERADLLAGAEELFAALKEGRLQLHLHRTYPLAEAASAHSDLEGRRTVGSSVLLP